MPRRAKEKVPAEPSPRVARRERRRERSREEIVEAARRVLLRVGLAGTTLDAVAKEVGLTKAALYYYYPSKDALLQELVFAAFEVQARTLGSAVDATTTGGEALRAVIRETVTLYAPRMDDFRLAYLHAQVAGPNALNVDRDLLAQIRPLNDLAYGGAAARLQADRARAPGRADVDPRLMVFLANLAAVGVLTMKGMVESMDDPLKWTDEQLIEGLARIFEAAAAP